jgi:hypothetical protein
MEVTDRKTVGETKEIKIARDTVYRQFDSAGFGH